MNRDETLLQKQQRFVSDVAKWIAAVQGYGYGITFGEAYRSDEQAEINAIGDTGRQQLANLCAGMPLLQPLANKVRNNRGNGIRNSLHNVRLALDFNLFKENKLCGDISDYKDAGDIWKDMGEDHCWGGDFKPQDVYHISIEHNGIK
jgi:hypothetical protein